MASVGLLVLSKIRSSVASAERGIFFWPKLAAHGALPATMSHKSYMKPRGKFAQRCFTQHMRIMASNSAVSGLTYVTYVDSGVDQNASALPERSSRGV